MRLNHLDLSVPDVAQAIPFFEKAFGFQHLETKGNAGMAILEGEGGFVLVLTRAAPAEHPPYPKSFHIGFLVASEQEVHAAFERIGAAGVDLPEPPRAMRGRLMFYVRGPGNILVEISHRPGAGDAAASPS